MPERTTTAKRPTRSCDRTPARRARDRRTAARLAVQGHSYAEIADKLGVSKATVFRDISECRERWDAEAARNVFEIRSRELAKVELVEGEAWSIFETAPDSDAALAALDRVLKAMQVRAKVYGLDRLQNLEAEREAIQERTRQAIDAVVNTVARYLTPEQFSSFEREVNGMLRESERTIYEALPAAPAPHYALPPPEDFNE